MLANKILNLSEEEKNKNCQYGREQYKNLTEYQIKAS